MSPCVAVVTDSTAYLPPELVAAHGITVVPLQVMIGARAYEEGRDVDSATVAEALHQWTPVSTSRPVPQTFLDAYRAARQAGATGVVSLHLSAEMSGTHESAVLAAREAPLPVRVVNSGSLGMALGFGVLAAADAAATGADLDACYDAATRQVAATTGFFYVDTLEHLRRGGRIGAAQALLGSALAVKPLLHLVDGRVEPLEKVRTASRAIARLEEIAVERAGHGPVDMAVHHLASGVRADALAERLRQRVPGLRHLYVSEVGAVVGAHVGPGMLGVVVAPVHGEASSSSS
jgi:DegV family protein with EDD domain